MTAFVYSTPNEKAVSGVMALVTHALFFALLVFGVTWQKREPEAMVVDLWNNLPPMSAPQAEPAPEVKPEPEPPKPQPKAEAKPVPKAEPKVEPRPVAKAQPKPVAKPDIALNEKKEKERKALEQELAEKKKRAQEQAQIAALKQQQAQEADAKQRAAREQEEAIRKLAQQQATAQTKLVDEYIGKIQAKIKSRVNRAGCSTLSSPEIQLKVILLPDGNVLGEPEVSKSSGGSPCDLAVTRAVLLAQPLPLPPDPALFPKFRELNLKVRPNE